jgi:monovalent cation:H+ antiporter-2, CPA2 family
MPHEINLISTIAVGLGLAMVFGFLAVKAKIPPLVGYLLAGIVVGPHTPGFVADTKLALQLAEIGVMLLMFGVGLHFSLKDLMSVKHIAIPGAVVQMMVATLLGMGMAHLWGWSFGAGLVFGISLSVASTVVLLKALEGRGQLESMNGRIAVGWLVMEDLAMVIVLVMLPPLAFLLGGTAPNIPVTAAGDVSNVWSVLGLTLAKVAAFVALMLLVGRKLFPKILWMVASTGSRELFTLCVIAAALGIAFGAAALFGVSFALGAFFAGMVLRESPLSHRAAEESLPLRDAFAVLFFVSVGMLFDWRVLIEEPLKVLGVVAIIMIGKTLAAIALVLIFRYPLNTALTVGVSLAQIGEFSFILIGLGVVLNIVPETGQSLVLAGALISIALNAALFAAIEPAQRWIRARSFLARKLERSTDPLAALPLETPRSHLEGHVILVGCGRVGRRVLDRMKAANLHVIVVEQQRERVEALREEGVHAVTGDAADPVALAQAHVAHAAALVIATPDTSQVRMMVDTARTLNPSIDISIRVDSEEQSEADAALLVREKAGTVFIAEQALGDKLADHTIAVLTARNAAQS